MNVDELNFVDLQLELEKRRLDSSGVQSVLAERLRKAIQSEGGGNLHESSKNVINSEKREKSQVVASGCNNLWVSDLVSSIKAQDLNLIFSKHGKVLYAKIFAKAEELGKCFGFVAMANSEDADNCINHLNKTEVNGQMIQIAKVKSEPGGPTKAKPTGPKALMVARSHGSKPTKEDFSPRKYRDQSSKNVRKCKTVIVAGNSIAGHFGRRTVVAARHRINIDLQCWPDANLSTILNNLRSYINPTHDVILIFGLTFEAWHYIPLLKNKPQPSILFPNPDFDVDSVVRQMESFVQFCNSVNPLMRVILVVPPIHDMFVYNVSRVKAYAPEYVEKFTSSPTFNTKSMAKYSRRVYEKISVILKPECMWSQKMALCSQKVMKSIPREPMKCQVGLRIKYYLNGRSDLLELPQALEDGLHPTLLFIKGFWMKFARLCKPLRIPHFPLPTTIMPDVAPRHSSRPERLARNTGVNYNVQNERQKSIEYNYLMREGKVLHPEQVKLMIEEERRTEEMAEKLLRERVNIRLEKQKLEREKEEFLRLEQEHLRIEREREEIRILQLKYEQLCGGQGVKRSLPASCESETLIYNQNSKRGAPDRNTLSWSSNRTSNRSGMMPGYEQDCSGRIQHIRSSDPQPQPPPASFRENRLSMDSQYNGDSESSRMVMDSWRLGTMSRASKNSNLGDYESTSSCLMGPGIGGDSQSGRYPSGEGSSINMSYSWGNCNSSMLNQTTNSSMLNQTNNSTMPNQTTNSTMSYQTNISSMPDQTSNTMNMMGMTDSLSLWGWSGTHRLE